MREFSKFGFFHAIGKRKTIVVVTATAVAEAEMNGCDVLSHFSDGKDLKNIIIFNFIYSILLLLWFFKSLC